MKLNFCEMNDFMYLFNKVSDYTALCTIRDYLYGTDRIKCNHLIRLHLNYIQKIDTPVSSNGISDYYKLLEKFLKNLGFERGGDGIVIKKSYLKEEYSNVG